MGQLTFNQLAYLGYRKAGLVEVEGTVLGPDQVEEFRLLYNSMVDEWALDGGTVSHVAREVFDIVPGKGDYTIGPNGDLDPTAPVMTSAAPVSPGEDPTQSCVYPVRIERASLIVSTIPTSAGPPEYGLWPMTIDEWQDWILKGQISNWPRRFYYEPDYPLGVLHLVWVPTDANQLALYLEQNLSAVGAVGDMLLNFRPGYQYFIECNMAVRLADNNPTKAKITEHTRSEAIRTLRLIQSSNDRPLSRVSDALGSGPARSNIYIGNRYLP